MASFSDLYATYGPNPASWAQYPMQLQKEDLTTQVGLNAFRGMRDFNQYNLPDMLSNFAAKGTYNSGMREREVNRLGTNTLENLGDQARSAGSTLADLSTKQVGANTGAGF